MEQKLLCWFFLHAYLMWYTELLQLHASYYKYEVQPLLKAEKKYALLALYFLSSYFNFQNMVPNIFGILFLVFFRLARFLPRFLVIGAPRTVSK